MKIFQILLIFLWQSGYCGNCLKKNQCYSSISNNQQNSSSIEAGNTLPYGEMVDLSLEQKFLNNRVLIIEKEKIKFLKNSPRLLNENIKFFESFVENLNDCSCLVKAFENFNSLICSIEANYSLIDDCKELKKYLRDELININSIFRDKLNEDVYHRDKFGEGHCDDFGRRIDFILPLNDKVEADSKQTINRKKIIPVPWIQNIVNDSVEPFVISNNHLKNERYEDNSIVENNSSFNFKRKTFKKYIKQLFTKLKSFPYFFSSSKILSQEIVNSLFLKKSCFNKEDKFSIILKDVFDHIWLVTSVSEYNKCILIPFDIKDSIVYEVTDGLHFWLVNREEINGKFYCVLQTEDSFSSFKQKVNNFVVKRNGQLNSTCNQQKVASNINYKCFDLESYKQILLSDFKEPAFIFFILTVGCFSALMFSLFVLNWSNKCYRCGHPALKFFSGIGNWMLGVFLGEIFLNIFIAKNISKKREFEARYTLKKENNSLFLDIYYRKKFNVPNINRMFFVILSCLGSCLFTLWPIVWFSVTEYFNKDLENITSFFAGLSCILGGVFTLSIFKFYHVFNKFPFLSEEENLV